MGDIIQIAFQGGTHGHFLMYFLDKCSKLTPELKKLPFDDTGNGTSHKKVNYSGKFQCYHPYHHLPDGTIGYEPIWQFPERPHIVITIEKEDIVFLERWVDIRTGNQNVDINKDSIIFTEESLHIPIQEKLKTLYGIDVMEVPRYIIRDLYKKNYLVLDQNGFIVRDRMYREQKPNNTFLFPVAAFWDEKLFRQKIKEVDEKFNLSIEFDKEVYDAFIEKLPWLKTKDRVITIVNAIKQNKDINIEDIDTIEQAYIAAWIEQNNDFICMHLGNTFFKTTGEIIQWLKYYPEEYKAMNPNLPTFNGMPNPFHLAKLKK